jgi:parallel beta-helix repeat protein
MSDNWVSECRTIEKDTGLVLENCLPPKHVYLNIILTFLFLCFLFPANATNYYVSNSGSDSNPGTSDSLSWRSLDKVNASVVKPGDRILFKRGDRWTGTIKVNASGTSGSPITFGAYGTGENPIISGFTTLSGWTDEGGNIYSKTIAVENNFPNIVLVDGVNTAMGRYPNTGTWLTYESHSGHTLYTDNELTGTPNWTGAQVVIRKNRWILEKDNITNHTNSILTVTPESTSFEALNGYGYFIQNDLKTLDVADEWYYNGSRFYIYSNPSAKTVKISTVNRLLVISGKDYITVENITFEGANSHAIQNTSGHDILIQHCNFLNIGMTGIYTDANSVDATMIIDDNTFDTGNNNAIHLRNSSTYAWIKNNTISNIGLIKGSATNVASAVGNAYDGINVYGANTRIEYNTISNVGHSGIAMRKNTGMIVRYNYISNFGLTRYDAGGIYTWNLPGATINNNIVDGSNHVSEGIAGNTYLALSGIYIDEQTEICNLYNNTVTNVKDFGIKYLNSRTGRLRNNTSYNNGTQFEFAYVYSYGFDVTGMDIKGNVFVSRSASQRVMIYKNDTSPLNQWGVADSNYYARPIDDNHTINTSTTTSLGTDRTVAGWQSLTGQDVNSWKSPQSITSENDLRFEYNATNSPKTITLSQPMIDVKGTKYATSVTVQPYSSIVLMKD